MTEGRKRASADFRVRRVDDIPFEHTKAPPQPVPPLNWLMRGTSDQRAEWINYWVYDTINGAANYGMHHALRLFPVDWVSGFGAVLSRFAKWRHRRQDFALRIRRNLAALLPELADDPAALDAAEAAWWNNTGRVYAEYSVVNRFTRATRLAVEGEENFDTAHKTGRPIIFVTLHLACWEGLMVVPRNERGIDLIGPYQPQPNRFANRLIYESRKRRRQYALPVGLRSAYYLRGLIGSRAAMGFFPVDEVRNDQIHFPTFGRPLPNDGSAVVATRLALAVKGLLVPVYMLRTRGAQFRMVVLPAIDPMAEADQGDPIPRTLRRLDRIYTPLVARHASQWYMLAELRLPKDYEKKQARTRGRDAKNRRSG
jgi:KDO2-lipid IV(A) lauroyltransferase